MKNKLKIGDYVRIKRNQHNYYENQVGIVVGFRNRRYENTEAIVKFISTDDKCGHFEYKLQKITKEKALLWMLENQ